MLETTQYNGRECELWYRENDEACTLATEQDDKLYVLILEPHSTDPVFRTRVSLGGVDRIDPILSARSIADYQRHFPGFQLKPHKQYLEVGAGLGEPLVALAKQAAASNGAMPKPTAIDPVPYELVRDLFGCIDERYAHLSGVQKLLHDIRELRSRCDILLDPSKVNLVRLPLEEAVQQHPQLRGSADVVVDLYGAAGHVKPTGTHAFFESRRDDLLNKFRAVLAQERSLLRETEDVELWVYKPRF